MFCDQNEVKTYKFGSFIEASRKKLQNGVHQSPYQRRSYERSESLPEKSSVYRTKPAVNVEQFPGEKDDNRRLQSNDRLSVDRPVNGQFTLRRMSKVLSEEEFDVQRHSLSDESDTLSDRRRHVEPSLHQTLVDQTVERSVDAPYVIGQSRSSRGFVRQAPLPKPIVRHSTFCGRANRVRFSLGNQVARHATFAVRDRQFDADEWL